MSLKYEPASEPLHISVKQLFLNGGGGVVAWVVSINVSQIMHRFLATLHGYRGTSVIRNVHLPRTTIRP